MWVNVVCESFRCACHSMLSIPCNIITIPVDPLRYGMPDNRNSKSSGWLCATCVWLPILIYSKSSLDFSEVNFIWFDGFFEGMRVMGLLIVFGSLDGHA